MQACLYVHVVASLLTYISSNGDQTNFLQVDALNIHIVSLRDMLEPPGQRDIVFEPLHLVEPVLGNIEDFSGQQVDVQFLATSFCEAGKLEPLFVCLGDASWLRREDNLALAITRMAAGVGIQLSKGRPMSTNESKEVMYRPEQVGAQGAKREDDLPCAKHPEALGALASCQ